MRSRLPRWRERACRWSSWTNRLLKKLGLLTDFAMAGELEASVASLFAPGGGVCSGVLGPFSVLQTDSSRGGEDFGDADEIICGGREYEEPSDPIAAAMTCLAQRADGLDPTERFLDLLALLLANRIAGMPRRTRVDRGAALGVVLSDVGCAATLTTAGDEVGGVVAFVGPNRAAGISIVVDHVEGGFALGGAIGLGK